MGTVLSSHFSGKTFTAKKLVKQHWMKKRFRPTMVVKDIGEIIRQKIDAGDLRFDLLLEGNLVNSGPFCEVVDEEVAAAEQNKQGVIFAGQPRKLREAECFISTSTLIWCSVCAFQRI